MSPLASTWVKRVDIEPLSVSKEETLAFIEPLSVFNATILLVIASILSTLLSNVVFSLSTVVSRVDTDADVAKFVTCLKLLLATIEFFWNAEIVTGLLEIEL